MIRCKKDFCKSMKAFVSSGKDDAMITLKHSLYWDKKGNKVTSQFKEPLEVRAVRIKLSENTEEYLITNLDSSLSELKQLYGKRWGVETMYDYLKNSMEIESFSSKKVEGVYQDFYSCILGTNMINIIIKEAQEELEEKPQNSNSYQYKINKRAATGILKNEIIDLILFEKNQTEKNQET